MRRALAIVIVLLIAGASSAVVWSWWPASISIADVGKATDVTLRAKDDAGGIYALDVKGSGHINGEAEITLILNGQPYKSARLRGPVHFSWGGDWYSPDAIVRYKPLSTTSGSLQLKYRFHSL